MTILHLKGLSPNGLAAALLACGGITKVKLQAAFKQLLPQPLIDHLQARGCVFQWRNKVFQVCVFESVMRIASSLFIYLINCLVCLHYLTKKLTNMQTNLPAC